MTKEDRFIVEIAEKTKQYLLKTPERRFYTDEEMQCIVNKLIDEFIEQKVEGIELQDICNFLTRRWNVLHEPLEFARLLACGADVVDPHGAARRTLRSMVEKMQANLDKKKASAVAEAQG